jgi:hypothetical protein
VARWLGKLALEVHDHDVLTPVQGQRVLLEPVPKLSTFAPNNEIAGPYRGEREDEVLTFNVFGLFPAHAGLSKMAVVSIR